MTRTNPTDLKTKISESLANFQNPEPVRAHGVRPAEPAIVGAHGVRPTGAAIVGATGWSPLRETAISLLNTLGYRSDKTYPLDDNTPRAFLETFDPDNCLNRDKALLDKWLTADLLFQLTDEELNRAKVQNLRTVFDPQIYQSYLFLAIELAEEPYSRTKLVGITREVNKLFAMPAMLLFKTGERLTLAIINRRPGKRDAAKDVLEKVTLIKDINLEKPHRAHIEILHDLALPNLAKHKITNFLDLHNAWQKTLDTSELNKKFFREIADWYFWALQKVVFPDDAEKDEEIRNATGLIRLITRLIFAWFLKEKGLVTARLFDETEMDALLNKTDKTGSAYYKAILQNLFFATLNTEMNRDKPGSRRFVKDQYMVHTFYRYRRYFKDPEAALKLFENIPFLNGGLFECLDRKDDAGNEIRIDCFSENPKHETRLQVPDELFFGAEQTVDLSAVFGDKRRAKEKVRGILRILDSYKFTVAENTPLEEEVALDPELLGKVFENLLASYNPETQTTARKQTGSFYTPREIVNYMVDESLIAYLETKIVGAYGRSPLPKNDEKNEDDIEKRLRQLFDYAQEDNPFSPAETGALIRAIDACKILDPACGSGAFPMGILHRLVYLLAKLDPDNRKWREVQKARAIEETEEAYNLGDREERHRRLAEIEETFDFNSSDYGRKLHLIENCIYGVDIQPIACQIAKLRFFISLVVEQREDRNRPNLGIRPLPNLETRFVAANTLIGLEEAHGQLEDLEVKKLKAELKEVRHRHFTARTYATKEKYRRKDKEIRDLLRDLLRDAMNPETAAKIAGWNPYDQNASADFFDMEWMFGIRDGFDVVIGNPPYGVQFTKKEKQLYNELFKFQNYQLDSYLLFIEKAFSLASTSSLIAYIIPNPWRTNLRLKNIRRLILTESMMISVANYKAKVFDATVDTEVIVLKKTKPTDNYVHIKIVEESDRIIENKVKQKKWSAFDGEPINIFTTEKEERILEKIRSDSVELHQVCKVISGLVPYEKGRGNPPQTRQMVQNRVYDANEKLDDSYRHVLRGKDIEKYLIKWNGHRWIKYGDNLAAPRYSADFDAVEKIVMRQTGDSLVATIDTKQFVCLKNMHVVHCRESKIELHYILGLLNSRLLNFYYQSLNPERGEALAEVKKENVEKLQIRICDLGEQQSIIEVVDTIISIKSSNLAADTRALENQIDLMVYKLYGLTWPEVKIVDPSFALSESEYKNYHP